MTTNPYLASISMKPKCNAYHDMELQNDGKGWNCDKCKTSHFNEDRWLCKTNGCDSDICVQCIASDGTVMPERKINNNLQVNNNKRIQIQYLMLY